MDTATEPADNPGIDLAAARIGGVALACSDDFFAEVANLIKPGRGIFIEDKYTDRGKWMDGWESRRSYGRLHSGRGERDYDWAVLRLGVAGKIRGLDIDTNHFRGNAPEFALVEACFSKAEPDAQTEWFEILPKSPLTAHSRNPFAVDDSRTWNHVRLKIYPDGGVARFRVYGDPQPDWSAVTQDQLIDLASIQWGGRALSGSNMFFSAIDNLIMPGHGINMGDGWETKRRRTPGNEWVILRLGRAGSVVKVIVDTCHFKGNFPDRFTLAGLYSDNDDVTDSDPRWQLLIDETPLSAHAEHEFIEPLKAHSDKQFTHIKLTIIPDGGVSRLRIFCY